MEIITDYIKRVLAKIEINNSQNFYLIQQESFNCKWLCSKAVDGVELVIFTEKAFNILNKDNHAIYTKHSSIKPIVDIAIRFKIPNIVFPTSKGTFLSYSVSDV